jgi:uncharacterized protein (DUF58 family)
MAALPKTHEDETLVPRLDDLLELRHLAHTLGLASRHQVNSQLCGMYASVFRGKGLDYEETREYREGDDIRNMDWRVTARTGTPHLKVFREERERAVMLCVDHRPEMAFGTRGTFKSVQAARVAALLGWSASLHQDRVGALLYGSSDEAHAFLRPTRSRQGLWRLLRALALPSAPRKDGSDALLLAMDRLDRGLLTGSLIFLIGDFNRDPAPLEAKLGSLRQRHDVVLIPIDDAADWEIPAMGTVTFVSPEGVRLELDTDNPAGREQYQAEWDRRRAELHTLVNRLGISVIPLSTDEDVHKGLLQGLARHARSRWMR